MALEDSHLKSADYGPAGYLWTGVAFKDVSGADLRDLAQSFEYLQHALTMLRTSPDPEDFMGWILLHGPYTGEPGDPSIVTEWRSKSPKLAERHDRAIRRLAYFLRFKELHAIAPDVMSETEEKKIENHNQDIAVVFNRLRANGVKEQDAMLHVAEVFERDLGAVERILEFRSELKPKVCKETGCDREIYQADFCQRHYWQDYRRRKNRNDKAS